MCGGQKAHTSWEIKHAKQTETYTVLCCTMKGKSDKTGMVENRNLEIERRRVKGRYPIIQRGYDQYPFDIEMH
jgi:hypothetical protein